jgi:hypothetical protein
MLLFVTKSTVMWYSAQLGEITAGAFVPMLTWAGYILETEGVFEKRFNLFVRYVHSDIPMVIQICEVFICFLLLTGLQYNDPIARLRIDFSGEMIFPSH